MKPNEQATGQTNRRDTEEYERLRSTIISSQFLYDYISRTGRLIVSIGDEIYIECPSLMCHSYCYAFGYIGQFKNGAIDEKDMEILKKRLSARIVVERGSKIARIACNECGASWDIFGLYSVENKCDRGTAIKRVCEIVKSGQLEKLAIDPLGRLLEAEREQ